ncbi:coatomer subunit epsilon-like [Paramacrobiotus metropolitanus]|uniref:coatomer subunit epsilon-like n=1 Tax=Paramacrobiotus metropolitanus TaxID=2943436 RepID=UPI00244634D9|nr:coatomer subunit epsilon-like [Paramacrobiotus metropolitanus]
MAQREPPADPLFDMRNSYYLGEYQKCINEAMKTKVSAAELKLERDIFMYRAYIALEKFKLVLDELRNTPSEELKAVCLLAEYMQICQASQIDESKRATVVKKLDEKLASGGVASTNYAMFIVAACIYGLEENYEAALRILHQSDHLECLAHTVFIYCKMERPDAAKKTVKRMQEFEEDATLTQIAEATVNLQMNGEHIQEAYHIFKDLSDKYSASTICLNGMVTALLCMGRWEEAEGYLQEALQKDPNNPSILANLIVCGGHTAKQDDVINRYINQLQDSHPNHQLTQLFNVKTRELERACRQYAPEVASP